MYYWPLPDDIEVQIRFLGAAPTVRSINRMILMLSMMRDDIEQSEREREPASDAEPSE